MKSLEPQGVENAGGANRRSFGSLHLFAIASLISFVAVAFLMGYLFRGLAIDGLLKAAEVEHIKLAQLIGNETWDDAFGPWIQTAQCKSAEELKAAPELSAIERKMTLLLKGTRIFKVKAYDTKGMTIFSTDLEQIGEDKSTNPGVKAGLLGLSSSHLVLRDEISSFEGEVQKRDLVESYVPHFCSTTGKVTGVFEIYGDATGVLAEIDRRQWYLVFVVIGPLALLYLALLVLAKRTQDAFLRSNRERQETE